VLGLRGVLDFVDARGGIELMKHLNSTDLMFATKTGVFVVKEKYNTN